MKKITEYTDEELNSEWQRYEDKDADWTHADGEAVIRLEAEMLRRSNGK